MSPLTLSGGFNRENKIGDNNMSSKITRFRIEKLHNVRTIDVAIIDNTLILVGENGTGKSTVANFIYFFLTKQWRRMLEYDFKSVLAKINDEEIKIDREDLAGSIPKKSRDRIHLPSSIRHRIESYIAVNDLVHPSFSELEPLADELGIPPHILIEYISTTRRGFRIISEKISDIEEKIDGIFSEQVLYLPTYRRIEQDLRSIFPYASSAISELREGIRRRAKDASFIELVEFGMEDVERIIEQKMTEIKDNVRDGLNTLTGTYLRDVIRGEYQTADLLPSLTDLDEETIDAIFSRIPQAILSLREQKRPREIIKKIQKTGEIDEEDKVVAHFLTQLVSLHEAQQEDEKDVREFIKLCNDYLSEEKRLIYDNLKFDISIVQRIGEESQNL